MSRVEQCLIRARPCHAGRPGQPGLPTSGFCDRAWPAQPLSPHFHRQGLASLAPNLSTRPARPPVGQPLTSFGQCCEIKASVFDTLHLANTRMALSRLILYPILQSLLHHTRHVAISHPIVQVASTSQGCTHQYMSHPPVKLTPTSQCRIHPSSSQPPVKVAPKSQGRTNKSRFRSPI